MTRDETKMIVMQIASSYSKHLMPELSPMMIDSWHLMLQDLAYSEAALATAAAVSVSQYPPTIADIRGRLAMAKTDCISSEEAFSLIREAVKTFGGYRAEEAIASLPEDIQIVVKRHGFGYFCEMSRDNITTYAAQFRREWEAMAEEKMRRKSIPEHINKQLEAMRPIRPQIAAGSEIL